MSKFVEVSAKNADLAIEQALSKLSTTRDKVEVEVLDEGRTGILGLGARDAVVRVTLIDTAESRAIEFLTETTSKMGAPATVTAQMTEESLKVDLAGENMGMLIGHHGDTLDALQYLTSLVVNRGREDYCRVISRSDYDGFQKLLHAHLLARFKKYLRSAH